MTRILIDASSTAGTRFNTGIQRVVRRVAECSQLLHRELGVKCIPVRSDRRSVVAVRSVAGVHVWDECLAAAIRNSAGSVLGKLKRRLETSSPAYSRALDRVATRLRKLFYRR